MLALVAGCRSGPDKAATARDGCLPESCVGVSEPAAADCQVPNRPARRPCQPTCAQPTCKPKPEEEVCQEEVHVNVPRQKVCVPAAKKPAAARSIEKQQMVQTRQVMLVPQQVLVPFVQTTTTGPIRVVGAQETQVIEATTVTNAAAVAAAAGTAETRTETRSATAAAATTDQCMAQLQQCEKRLNDLTRAAEALCEQVEKLKASTVPPMPPSSPRPSASPKPIVLEPGK